MDKCPFCKGENIEQINNMDYINKNYKKVEGNGISISNPKYPISRFFCTDCGMTFRKMKDKTLQDYKTDKPFFC